MYDYNLSWEDNFDNFKKIINKYKLIGYNYNSLNKYDEIKFYINQLELSDNVLFKEQIKECKKDLKSYLKNKKNNIFTFYIKDFKDYDNKMDIFIKNFPDIDIFESVNFFPSKYNIKYYVKTKEEITYRELKIIMLQSFYGKSKNFIKFSDSAYSMIEKTECEIIFIDKYNYMDYIDYIYDMQEKNKNDRYILDGYEFKKILTLNIAK